MLYTFNLETKTIKEAKVSNPEIILIHILVYNSLDVFLYNYVVIYWESVWLNSHLWIKWHIHLQNIIDEPFQKKLLVVEIFDSRLGTYLLSVLILLNNPYMYPLGKIYSTKNNFYNFIIVFQMFQS